MREKFWELAGSKLGDILKIQKPKEDEEEEEDLTTVNEKGEVDYKSGN
jgi:pre-mRNA-splicing factor ATP-dependent RNA helicase DHX38/PRP16